MTDETRPSGIEAIGNVPPGTHFCLFYQNRQDLIDVIVPYFKAGLESNEYCLCITSDPLRTAGVKRQMAAAIPDFDRYLKMGQVEILAYNEWYEINGVFDAERVTNGWIAKLREAQERGFSGMRLTGNTFWLEKAGWKKFMDYEDAINDRISRQDIIALCTYSLEKCDAGDIIDVVGTHQFALTRRDGEWSVVENRGLKETKAALQSSEDFLGNVFCSIQDGISVLDMDFNIVRANPVKERWHQHALPLAGKKCYRAFHGRSEPCPVCPSRRAIERKTTQTEILPLQDEHDNIKGWLEINAYPLTDNSGAVIGVIEHVRDITERKLAEEALQESENKFKAIFNRAALGLAISSPTGRIIDCNSAYQKILGYGKEELRKKNFLELTHKDDIALNANLQRQMNDGLIDSYQLEKRYIHRNGKAVMCKLITSAIRNSDGSLKYNMAIVEDITERKRMEEELKNAKQQAELYLDLLGHDINNMHQIALGYLEMARDMPPGTPKNEMIDTPIRVLQRSARLIGNVRKLQQINEGLYQMQDIDVARILSGIQNEFGAVPGKSVTLKLNGCSHCRVRANELLHDVFANLVSNGIKHTGDRADININLDVANDNGGRQCRVSIEDNGPGIPDGFKARIFNRILKGTNNAKGMGLGLYLVKSLVESYGGRVWVEDRVAGDHTKGARFVVMLPAVEK